ncbi:hypothetical protein AB1Y20_004466 [Prymnesium parvum]|uniref:Conserved oligomeric Golgi complex subunit 4 N-terminal domain-containing protein n=1 Tax=Prymnesium parvum TaxID=97485 RepID=A0AB34IYU7_PRYPA
MAAADVAEALREVLGETLDEERILDLEWIDSTIRELQEREAQLLASLHDERALSLQRDAQSLPALRARGEWLSSMSSEFRELRFGLEAATEHSSRISAHVRRLHTESARVREVRSFVEELVALEACGEAVDEALGRQDFGAAVERVQALLTADAAGIGAEGERITDGQRQLVSRLEASLQREIDAAAAAHDEARLSHMSRRPPPHPTPALSPPLRRSSTRRLVSG